ncbi:glycosyltransferase family 2 protein [Desulfomicrobium baculatum]|nr:glycosyltransferase [Desulfomicrobium baculatum]
MAVNNGESHLQESIDSILGQSFKNFEFVIIDDGSNDSTWKILCSYAISDQRIKIFQNHQNLGLASSLNKGLGISKAPYVARMDADDWSFPDRLEIQYEFMKNNLEVAVCGAWIQEYESGEIWRYPVNHADIVANLLFNNAIAHPVAMLNMSRLNTIVDGYDESLISSQDYSLWERIVSNNSGLLANIPQPLLRYRTYPQNKRSIYKSKQLENANSVRLRFIHRLGIVPREDELLSHIKLAGILPIEKYDEVVEISMWADKIIDANRNNRLFSVQHLSNYISYLWYELFRKYSYLSVLMSFMFLKYSPVGFGFSELWCFFKILLFYFIFPKK